MVADFDGNRLARIERVNVIGTSGSGKSTFGRRLAELLGLPFVEMDRLYWGPNWEEPTDEEFFPKVKAVTDEARWVLDGNYSRTTPVKWRRVQLVVWLDMSFVRTLMRVSLRCVKRSLSRREVWPGTGNRETLGKSFLSRDSIILWAITRYGKNRGKYSKIIESPDYSHIWFVRLTSRRQVDSFLRAARTTAAQTDGSAKAG